MTLSVDMNLPVDFFFFYLTVILGVGLQMAHVSFKQKNPQNPISNFFFPCMVVKSKNNEGGEHCCVI